MLDSVEILKLRILLAFQKEDKKSCTVALCLVRSMVFKKIKSY